jgi:hypothetical protein
VNQLSLFLRACVTSALLLLAGISCSDPPTAPSPLDQRFTLAPGEMAQLAEPSIGVRFDGVSNDSRCPADALCLLGGDALVHVTVVAGSSVTPYELHTGSMEPVRHGDLTVALETLMPYPFSSLPPIGPSDYRATIRVIR